MAIDGKKNKVKFNLKNVHIAPITANDGSKLTYDTPFALPGAVSLSLEPQGDIEKFYADGIVYYQSALNNGYEGDLEVAMITDEFREKIFKEDQDTKKVEFENINREFSSFALGFQVDGDSHHTLFWFYNCTATRPSAASATLEETKTPQTETVTVSCAPDPDGNVRAKTTEQTDEETLSSWFDSVYTKQDAAA